MVVKFYRRMVVKMVKKIYIFILLGLSILLLLPNLVYGVSVSASLTKTTLTLDDRIRFTIAVEGVQNAPQPSIPPIVYEYFDVSSSGTSSSVQIINGSVTQSLQFNFILTPKKIGSFTIPSITLSYQGQDYSTEPIQVNIIQGGTFSQGGQGTSRNFPTDKAQASNLYLETEVSNRNPYIGEQIIFTARIVSAYQLTNPINWINPPVFDGFLVEELGDKEISQYTKLINGRKFNILEVRKILFPVKSGQIIIPQVGMQCGVLMPHRRGTSPFDDFFDFGFGNTELKNLYSNPIEVNVLELPQGKPHNFSGLVGNITLTAELGNSHIKMGESTTLTLKLKGDGNIRSLNQINVQGIDNFKSYDDTPEFKIFLSGDKLLGEKIFKKALAPLKAGTYNIPPIEISYFDNSTKQYKVAKSNPFVITVEPSSEKEELVVVQQQTIGTNKKDVKILGKDILDIHTSLSSLKSENITSFSITLYFILFLFPIGGYLFSYNIVKKQRLLKTDPSYARSIKAFESATKKLEDIRVIIAEGKKEEATSNLSKLLKDYIGDKFNVTGGALTSDEIESILKREEILNEEMIVKVKKILETCEMIQFASSKAKNIKLNDLVKEVETIISSIEESLKNRKYKKR